MFTCKAEAVAILLEGFRCFPRFHRAMCERPQRHPFRTLYLYGSVKPNRTLQAPTPQARLGNQFATLRSLGVGPVQLTTCFPLIVIRRPGLFFSMCVFCGSFRVAASFPGCVLLSQESRNRHKRIRRAGTQAASRRGAKPFRIALASKVPVSGLTVWDRCKSFSSSFRQHFVSILT